jgi:23S rRNA (pseudouridine1915-N3)-methyltransferase
MALTIHLFSIGNKPPDWVEQGFTDYASRLTQDVQLKLVEIAPAARHSPKQLTDTQIEQYQRQEAEHLQQKLSKLNAGVVALDLSGQDWSTPQLAEQLHYWQRQHQHMALLIGGANGLHHSCLQWASQRWRLSKLTFPHMLVRVIVAEQLYRAWTINQGHPYHK